MRGEGVPSSAASAPSSTSRAGSRAGGDADDVEHIIRENAAQGISSFFITDDNFARNLEWEPILDRLIELRERDGLHIKLTIQVDLLCHKIKGFIEKCIRAGTKRVFLGLESINPEALAGAKKRQNRIGEYREMLQAWHTTGVTTCAGYILGFPTDTPESIIRDIRIIQRELPIDIMEFFILTPLPGSEDHQKLYEKGVWMDPDMNKYDSTHVTTAHPLMTPEEWKNIYDLALGNLLHAGAHGDRPAACPEDRNQPPAGRANLVLLQHERRKSASAGWRLSPAQVPPRSAAGASGREPVSLLSEAGVGPSVGPCAYSGAGMET